MILSDLDLPAVAPRQWEGIMVGPWKCGAQRCKTALGGRGATAVEYTLIAGGIAVAVASVVGAIGADLNSIIHTVHGYFNGS